MDIQDIFAAHFDALHRYLVRLTGDGDLAADLAQEAFIRFVECEPENDNPKGWLFAVATNLARDHMRVSSRRLVLLKNAPDEAAASDRQPDPHERIEATEQQAFVRAVLAELPERERSMLLMQQEGFSHKEIADAVGTTTKSVGTLLARAAQRFTRQLTPLLEKL